MMLIRKNSSSILGCLAARSTNFAFFSSPHFLTPLPLFTSKADDPSPQTPFIVKFLIDSVGLSSEEAAKASKSITHIKGPSQPDSVLEFFRKNGFTDTDIKRIVSLRPNLLCAKADSTLKLKLDDLRELGFSETQIIKLITANPFIVKILTYRNLRPRIEFLSVFLHSNDEIVKALSNDTSLLSCSLEKIIKPNIDFLRECHFSDERIRALLIRDKQIIGRPLNFLKSNANRVHKLGFPCESGMFFLAFRALVKANPDVVDTKIKFMGSLGFSRAEIVSTIQRQPSILCLSMENLRETVDFLVKELVRKKGLLKKELDFCSIVTISERRFLEKFVYCFQERMPELHNIYLSASAGKFLN